MNKFKIRQYWKFGAILWTMIIFILSILPGSTIKEFWTIDFFSMDKVAHMAVYFVLAVLVWKSLEYEGFLTINGKTILLGSSFGILMEIVQFLFFPYRYFDLFDIIANIIGSTAGVVAIYFLTYKKQ